MSGVIAGAKAGCHYRDSSSSIRISLRAQHFCDQDVVAARLEALQAGGS